MSDVLVGRALRALRHRRGWRQSDVRERAGRARSELSFIERGEIGRFPVETLRRYAAALDAHVVVTVRWRGGELDRLLDADHAALQDAWKRRLERAGWVVEAETTYSEYGERGRYDLLAWHPATGVVLVVEIKTVIADIQRLLGSLDAKVRLARRIARRRGWLPAVAAVPLVVVVESRTNRRRVAEHPSLFARFPLRGRRAHAWLSAPAPVTGLLAFSTVPTVVAGNRRRAGRQRVRQRATQRSVADGAREPSAAAGAA